MSDTPKDVNDAKLTKDQLDALKKNAGNNIIDFIGEVSSRLSDEDKIMKELNESHIFVNNIGGKNFITYMAYDDVTERRELELIQIDSFRNIYSNRAISTPIFPKGITIAQLWLGDTKRNTVEGLLYEPSEKPYGIVVKDTKKYLNTWAGYHTQNAPTTWRKTKRHIYKILCNSDPHKFKYVVRWLAWMVQNPDKSAGVVLVFKGERGGGKSFLFVQFKKLFARHGMIISDPSRLTGKFSSHFENLSYLFCDEVYYPGNKEVEGRMKSIITEEFIDVESKFQNARMVKNRLHIIMCTNNEWVIPAASGERRFFIEEINNMYAMGRAPNAIRDKYHKDLWDEMDNGGREAMLKDLLKYNLKGWHPRKGIPQTKELQKQKEMSLNPLQQSIKIMLEDAQFPGERKFGSYFVNSDVINSYLEKLEPYCIKFSSVRKATAMKELGIIKSRGTGGKIRWEFPELKQLRKNFDKVHGRVAWDDTEKWYIQKSEF